MRSLGLETNNRNSGYRKTTAPLKLQREELKASRYLVLHFFAIFEKSFKIEKKNYREMKKSK